MRWPSSGGGGPPVRRLLFGTSGLVSSGLSIYGGAIVLIGLLVLTGLIAPSERIDETALRWHVFVWDLWFVLWGIALGVAAWQHRPPKRNESEARSRPR